jgi:hypothetical protein
VGWGVQTLAQTANYDKIALMQRQVISTLALMMALGFGCLRQETQQTLAGRLSAADRVIVVNAADGATLIIKDEQLKKLVQAIGASQKLPASETITAAPGFTLVFFRSHLAAVPTGAELVFYIDKKAYEDRSGTLRAVCERFWLAHPSSR